jgi:hypothetical protein
VTIDDASAEVIGFVPWGQPDGPSEWMEPAWLPTSADTYAQPPMYGEPRLRVLPDGSPQLTLRNSAGARVVRLGAASVQVAAEFVRDAVMTSDGNVVLLEQTANHTFNVRCVTADGTVLWSHSYPSRSSDEHGVRYDSRLLADSRGRVFVTVGGALIQVDESASSVVASYSGGRAVMCPDGRIGYRRGSYWVVRDIDTAEETTAAFALGGRDIREVIGVDAAGRVYWRGYTTVARMSPDGDFDWLMDIGGIAVSEKYGVTILTYGENGRVARFDNGNRVSVDLSAEDSEGRIGRLAGRGDDGEYLLHRLNWARRYRKPDARLTYLDRAGRLLRTELAPDEMWLAMDIAKEPDFSSVTSDGAVLVAVNSELGVHVVRLTPGRAVKEEED